MRSDLALPRDDAASADTADDPRPAPGLARGQSPDQARDQELASAAMIRYAAGDDRAFADVYAALAPRLYRFCICLAGRGDADDLLQEVFLKMHRARATFVRGGSVTAWSFAIARTTSIDRARSRRRQQEDSAGQAQLERHGGGPADSPEASSLGQALEQTVWAQLLALPETLRAAYALVKIEGLSSPEAAQVLGITATATKERVHRASVALRQALEAAGWEERHG
ncbi:MAG: RNA polymerase sigma factor [Polyangiales bacterium]